MEEIWKDIKGYEDLYQVSNFGMVKSLKREKILKPRVNKKGYSHLILYNGVGKELYIHQLVARAFIINPENFLYINHKDENPKNNNVGNLEWCDCKYNSNYGTRNKKVSISKQRSKNPNSKKVYQYDLGGNLINVWNCVIDASKNIKCDPSGISHCARGKTEKAYGYVWKY